MITNVNVGDIVAICEISVVTSISGPTYVMEASGSVTSVCHASRTGYKIDIFTILDKLKDTGSFIIDPYAPLGVGRVVKYLNHYGVITKRYMDYDGALYIHLLFEDGSNEIVPPTSQDGIIPCAREIDIKPVLAALESVRGMEWPVEEEIIIDPIT